MKNNVFFKESEVKKTNQYEALNKDVWDSLSVSVNLYLYKEKEDIFLCYIKNKDSGNDLSLDKISDDEIFKIGLISKEDANPIELFLDALQIEGESIGNVIKHTNDLFRCVISKCDKKADEDKRISVAIFIKKSSSTQK